MILEQEQLILPFLKWAGGKRWFTSALDDHLPATIERYIEPFLGSGAAFFSLQPQKAVLSDLNEDLIDTYAAIRDNWRLVEKYLLEYDARHSREFYYDERARSYGGRYQRAAKFIYLNRVCWNGLYRVNLKGEFNVPLGTKTKINLETDNFEATSDQLQRCTLYVSDFEEIIDDAKKNDFLFVDPPYVTAHNFNGFAKYNEHIFSWDDQKRLSRAIRRAVRRGAKVLLMNANHPSIRNLYEGVGSIKTVSRASVIAGGSAFRQKISELLIKTYA